MARVDCCKRCGRTELAEGVSWVGTNHSLCSLCVEKSRIITEGRGSKQAVHIPLELILTAAIISTRTKTR